MQFIELDDPYWFSNKAKPTIRKIIIHFQLVQECDLNYSIILCSEDKLIDGMYRLVKAIIEKRETIDAVRL